MDALDLIIVMCTVLLAARGITTGFARQLGSLGGFVLGLLLGAIAAPPIAALAPSGTWRQLATLAIFFGVAITVAALGELLGNSLAVLMAKYRMRPLDAALGATFGIVVALIVTWLLAAVFEHSTSAAWAIELHNSRIVQYLDASMPPAPNVVASLERTFGNSDIPNVFAGLEPSPAPPVTGPNAAAVNAAATAGQAATVRVEGFGCGGLLEGTGIVVAKNLVATNAHVVAGISRPTVVDSNGSHNTQVVYFNPEMDFAILRTSGLAATPLPLDSSTVDRGTVGAVLGYPGGGAFTVSSAAVLQRETAVGRDIYDSNLVSRQIYVLQAVVRPGNSGGPLITPQGSVVGIVFAMSTSNPNVGYALTSAEVKPDIAKAQSSSPVSTQQCVSD